MAKAYSATVLGGFWPDMSVPTLTNIGSHGAGRRRIAQILSRKGMRDDRALLSALIGAVAGSAAVATTSRIEASSELGGKRNIETETLINRNTLPADDTELTADLTTYTARTTFGASPPVNLDGNPLGTR